MKKLLILFIAYSGIAYGQFTVSESSNDWIAIGKEVNDTKISINGGKGKIKIIDFRTKTMGFDPLSTFKTTNQNNAENLQREVRKGNEGVKSGAIEFVFNTEPDTIDKLYALIIDHFDNKRKEVVTLTFPEGDVYLDFNSRTAFYAVSFGLKVNDQKLFGPPMIKSQINKLFGKN